jgi:hypothetical protein
VSLRDEIAAVLSRDHGLTRRQRFAIPTTADAILALVRAHLTSDEAVERAMICTKCKARSEDNWSQCRGVCPMPGSPWFVQAAPREATNHPDPLSDIELCSRPGVCNCPNMPRCPVCNYTAHDAAYLMDHNLCKGRIP